MFFRCKENMAARQKRRDKEKVTFGKDGKLPELRPKISPTQLCLSPSYLLALLSSTALLSLAQRNEIIDFTIMCEPDNSEQRLRL
jgi:hypothetical protein